MFLLPGLIITLYTTDKRLSRQEEQEIARYILSMQNLGSRNDSGGGWGLHTAGDSTVFGTAMNYTALRLLGIPAEDPCMRKARSCLYKMGGAINGPHWMKFWLSVLGVMDWDIVNPVPPELWLLPDWTPISPWRWWVHMRQVYLPMGHIWSKKWSYPRADTDPLIKELRQELFTQPHAEIRWPRFRNAISPIDNYNPKSWVLNVINWLLVMVYIPYLRIDWLIKRAEAWTWQLIQIEDKNTKYAGLAPVNSPMNYLCCFIEEGPDAYSVKCHRERLHDFLWMSEGGMMMNGTDGVQTWDTAFTIQAVVAAGLADDPKYHPMMEKALSFLESQQFISHPHGYENSSAFSDPPTAKTTPEAGYRQARRGAWGFSTRSQGYTVSDCTSEALKAILELQALPSSKGSSKAYPELMSFERLRWAADIILSMQNSTGGIASYEIRRGSERLEYLNAAEVFGRIMVEYDYPECTTSCVTAMHLFSKAFPDYRRDEVAVFQARAVEWIRTNQRVDGSWYGSWAICFTYAAMFALESLKLQGEVYQNSERVRRACKFLVDHQNEDGGWGESFKSCETGEWCDHPDGSQVVNTSWTVIALLEAGYADREVLDKAVALLMRRQQSNGEWLQEGIEGVFNKSW
jgi:lanosterol synthase